MNNDNWKLRPWETAAVWIALVVFLGTGVAAVLRPLAPIPNLDVTLELTPKGVMLSNPTTEDWVGLIVTARAAAGGKSFLTTLIKLDHGTARTLPLTDFVDVKGRHWTTSSPMPTHFTIAAKIDGALHSSIITK